VTSFDCKFEIDFKVFDIVTKFLGFRLESQF